MLKHYFFGFHSLTCLLPLSPFLSTITVCVCVCMYVSVCACWQLPATPAVSLRLRVQQKKKWAVKAVDNTAEEEGLLLESSKLLHWCITAFAVSLYPLHIQRLDSVRTPVTYSHLNNNLPITHLSTFSSPLSSPALKALKHLLLQSVFLPIHFPSTQLPQH